MDKILEFFSGKKTFIVALVAAIIAGIQAFSAWTMPTEGWAILGALGLSAVRVGIKKSEPAE